MQPNLGLAIILLANDLLSSLGRLIVGSCMVQMYKQLTLSQQIDGEYGLGNPKSIFVHLWRVKLLSRRAYAEFTTPMSTERKVDGYCNEMTHINFVQVYWLREYTVTTAAKIYISEPCSGGPTYWWPIKNDRITSLFSIHWRRIPAQ